jgi:hypothetical protein
MELPESRKASVQLHCRWKPNVELHMKCALETVRQVLSARRKSSTFFFGRGYRRPDVSRTDIETSLPTLQDTKAASEIRLTTVQSLLLETVSTRPCLPATSRAIVSRPRHEADDWLPNSDASTYWRLDTQPVLTVRWIVRNTQPRSNHSLGRAM